MRRRFLVLTTIGFLGASLGLAQEDDDPPSRAARLSYLSGSVSFQPGSVDDWVPATLNRPMTTGDRLWTEAGGRAEMHLGSAALRVNGRTSFAFLDLDDQLVQVQVSVGTLNVRLRNLADGETFEIDTPQLALTLLRPGEYRVDVDDNGEATIVSVRGGEADATAESDAITVRARDQVRASGTDRIVFDRRNIPPADNFDNFCENRDRSEDMSQSARYVSRDIPGYEDLDRAGVWRETPEFGAVWYPGGLDPGWAPYRYGHWTWISPWGWTWVDDEPWGYAPFHYGRWIYAGGGWGWVPGPLGPRPAYAPAMVAWVGGGGFSVGIGIGGPSVGWFPLGPREVWVPSYRHSPRYIERVNVTNTVIVNRTVINNVNVNNVTYRNRNVAGAVTAMPRDQMVEGRSVRGAGRAATPQMISNTRIENTAAVAPDRRAVLGSRAGTAAPPPPASVNNRQIMARQAPPPAPVPFQQQQQRLQENPGQPVPRSTLRQLPPAPQGGAQPGGGPGGQGGQGGRPTYRQVGPRNGNPGTPGNQGGNRNPVGAGQGPGGGNQGAGGGRPGAGPAPNAVTPQAPGPGPAGPQPQERRRQNNPPPAPTTVMPGRPGQGPAAGPGPGGTGPGGPPPLAPGGTPPPDRRIREAPAPPAPGAPPPPAQAPAPRQQQQQQQQPPNGIAPLRPGAPPEQRRAPPETRTAPPAPAPQAVPPPPPPGGGGGNPKQNQPRDEGKQRPPERDNRDNKGKDKDK